jgi:hypothetical protein
VIDFVVGSHLRDAQVGYKIIENPTPALQPESNSAFPPRTDAEICTVFSEYRRCVVRRTVIHNQQFPIGMGLREQTGQSPPQERSLIKGAINGLLTAHSDSLGGVPLGSRAGDLRNLN